MQVVQNEYAEKHAKAGCCQLVTFDKDAISLNIDMEGIFLKDGWTICPMMYPAVSYTCTLDLHKYHCHIPNNVIAQTCLLRVIDFPVS